MCQMLLCRAKQLKKQVVSMLVLVVIFAFAHAEEPRKKTVAVNIETALVTERSLPVTLSSIGTLRAQDDTELSFAGSGHLEKICFPEGATVKKGDVIAVLDGGTANAQLASAQAKLLEAQSNYQRYQLVKDKNVFSEVEQISIKTKLEEAKANKKVALSALEDMQLKAPYDGMLGNYRFDLGAYINVGAPVVRLVDVDRLDVTYSLSQGERNNVKVGQMVQLTSTAVPGHTFKGSVIYVAPIVDSSTGRFDVKAGINNKNKLLAPGFSSNILHFLGKQRQVLIIPQTAIVADGANYFVFRVTPDNHVERIMVKIGNNTNDGFTEITQGLKIGDQVATTGTERLESGTLIAISNTRPPNKIPARGKNSSSAGKTSVGSVKTLSPAHNLKADVSSPDNPPVKLPSLPESSSSVLKSGLPSADQPEGQQE